MCLPTNARLDNIKLECALFSVVVNLIMSTVCEKSNSDELLALTVVHRHGDRTPIVFYPNDPYKDSSIWNGTAAGDLTNVGKQQMYELGKWMRARYDNFLSKTYHKKEIYVLSSDEDRCIRSASALLAGLYPPVDTDVWNPNLPWNPIPVHAIPAQYDDILYNLKSCPRRMQLFMEFLKRSEEENKDLIKYLEKHSGKQMRSILDIMFLADALSIETKKKLALPEWTRALQPEKLKSIRDAYFYYQTSTLEITKFSVGRFHHELLKQFDAYAFYKERPHETKVKIYSGHDINIHTILESLKIPHSVEIPLAAALLIELRKSTSGDLYVQMLYKTDKTMLLPIVENDSKYGYEQFASILKTMAVSKNEYRKLCEIQCDCTVDYDVILQTL
ncbi:hypothetical protein HHI36_010034 [Cryptolaemus montrouzieri]|uniref:acid phosphatase n=1 Tax=Cryptolaemus montrouzieri TaxID=559131 RepID=A0ABD2MHM2_9CUCU